MGEMGSKVGGAAPGFEPGTSCMRVRSRNHYAAGAAPVLILFIKSNKESRGNQFAHSTTSTHGSEVVNASVHVYYTKKYADYTYDIPGRVNINFGKKYKSSLAL